MTPSLPAYVNAALGAMLDGVSRKELATRAAKLSERYRAGGSSAAAISERDDVLAYLVTRMPATYAAVAAALNAVRAAAPDFVPAAVLDAGAGPGTASFAAVATWPEIESVTMIDTSRHFIAAAGDLTAASPHRALTESKRILGDASRFGRDLPQAALVLAAYVVGETTGTDALVATLWAACTGALVLVEPGTPDGFARIRDARAALVAAGATIAAPCAHDRPCPIVAPDWCHFAQRLSRSRDHRLAKAADAPFEDEKFSYVVAMRPAVARVYPSARVLAPPRVTKADIRLKLCLPDGTIGERVVARRDRAGLAAVRRLHWGDAFDQSGSKGAEAADSSESAAGSSGQ